MFSINHIKLVQYRNYIEQEFHFSSRITAICGLNGKGKTNLLDAIYQLCFTKSYFGKPDSISASLGLTGYRLTATFHKNGKLQEVSLIQREGKKKELQVDGVQTTPFSLHIGKMPVVFIAPDDVELISGPSEGRRKMVDTILSQTDHDYLLNLIQYSKVLEQRNSYLRSLNSGEMLNEMLLNTYDEQLVQHGTAIIDARENFFSLFNPVVMSNYSSISNDIERPSLKYVVSVDKDSYLSSLKRNRQRDILLQRTTIGIHKDDLEMTCDGVNFKLTASQGQRKSMLFALKLAEFSILKNHFGFDPILLLDDIFEKLDQNRLSQLLKWVCIDNKGQVLLTDTHYDRVKDTLDEIKISYGTIILK